MSLLKHCFECDKLIHPSFGTYCSKECEEVCEAAALLKKDGRRSNMENLIHDQLAAVVASAGPGHSVVDVSTQEDRKHGKLVVDVEMQVAPISYISLDIELSS